MNQHILTGQVDITSNLLVGSSHLFVDTTNNRVGLVTNDPHAGLHVNSNAYVNTDLRVGSQIEINETAGRIKAASFEGDGSLLVNAPVGSLAVHSTDTGLPGTDALVTNEGTPTAAEFKFVIPRGDTGTAATVAVGTTTTGAAGSSASVTNTGSSSAASFDFTIPRGDTGATGPTGTVAIGTTTTGAAGSSASVTNTGTSTAANLEFTVPRGDQGVQGIQGPAATIAVGTTTTSAPGTNGSVTNSGSSSAAVFDFTVPRGADGTNYFTLSGSNIYRSTGNVGIGGVASATNRLKVHGTVEATSFSGGLTTSVTPGSYLTGSAYNGSTARTFAVDATTTNTASKIVARDSNGDIYGRYLRGEYVNISHSTGTRNSDTIFYSSTDNYIRKTNASGMRSSLGLANSATIEATTADTANKIAQRNASGDIFARLFRSDYPSETYGISSAAFAYRISTSDNYIRFCNDMGAVRSRLGAYGNGSNITRSTHSNGYLVGSYNNVGANDTKTNPIYTIGSNYMPSDTSLSNMYGIGYSHSSFTSMLVGGWGMYVAADGDARIGLCGSSGHIKCTSHIYCGNTVFVGGSTSRGLRGVSGNYGTVQTTGEGAGGHEGYSINGRWVFMSGDANSCGIYNDTDDDWSIICYRNGKVRLDYNGSENIYTQNNGATVNGELNASAFSVRGTGGFGYNWDGVFMRPDGQVYISVDDNFYFRDNHSSSSNLRRVLCDTNGGHLRAEGTVSSNYGLDYAEYFEWFDGNPDNEDRIGYSVSLVENTNKIKRCEPGEIPLGVVSGTSSMTGGGASIHWNGYWKNDEWGRATYKQLEDDNGELVFNEDGTPKMKRAINPDYDETLDSEYLSRDQRKEWACVGLLGQVFVKKGDVTSKNWIKMKEVDSVKDLWFINAVFVDNGQIETIQSDLQAEKVKTKNLEALVLSLITRVQKLEAR